MEHVHSHLRMPAKAGFVILICVVYHYTELLAFFLFCELVRPSKSNDLKALPHEMAMIQTEPQGKRLVLYLISVIGRHAHTGSGRGRKNL